MSRKFKDLPISEIIDLYQNQGISTTKIAKMYNVNSETIRNHLKRNGIEIKSKKDKGKKLDYSRKDNKINIEEMIYLYKNHDWLVYDLARYYEVNYETIRRRLIKNGVELRRHSESKKIAMNRKETKEKTSEVAKRTVDQRKKTNLERYGHEVAADAPHIRKQWEDKHEEKYGVRAPSRRPEAVQKRNKTLTEKYNTTNLMEVEEVRNKIKRNRWIEKSEEELNKIKEKSKASPEGQLSRSLNVKKNRWENKSEKELAEIFNKTLATWKANYDGLDNPLKHPNVRDKLKRSKMDKFINYELPRILDYLELDILNDEWNGALSSYTFKCRNCGYEFCQTWNEVQQGFNCLKCYPRTIGGYTPKAELELQDFILNELGITNFTKNDRSITYPLELDLVLLDYNLAIEHNGLYWHREENHNYNYKYHLDKLLKCNEKGLDLIQIFEDEWVFKKEIIKSRIKQILGLSSGERINPRDCKILEINTVIKNQFLEEFHLQGKDSSVIKLGAFYNNELVAVMTFSHGSISKGTKPTESIWELSRFCTNYNYHIPGIAGKLLEHFKRNYSWEKIFTYADRRWSNGNLYFKLGLNHVHNTEPNYWYTYGLKRIHRFGFRKRQDEPKEIPEWKLRLQEGYHRIWDCGNMKFELTNK